MYEIIHSGLNQFRTDAGVHAIRNAFIMQIPIRNADEGKSNLLDEWNHKANECIGTSLRVLDFHTVSRGFCSRRNVSYRYICFLFRLVKFVEDRVKN